MTVGDLQGLGYSDSEIQTLFGQAFDTPTTGGGGFIGPVASPGGGGGGGDWLTGLTGVFGAVGTTVTNVFRAFNPPPPGTRLINPATGLPYSPQQIQQLTGQPFVGGNSGLVTLLLIALVIWAVSKS